MLEKPAIETDTALNNDGQCITDCANKHDGAKLVFAGNAHIFYVSPTCLSTACVSVLRAYTACILRLTLGVYGDTIDHEHERLPIW